MMATHHDTCAVIGAIAIAVMPVALATGVFWVAMADLVGWFIGWYALKHFERVSPRARVIFHGGWGCLAVMALLPYLRVAVGG